MIVLEGLTAVGFMINLAKCGLLKSEVKMLGCMISKALSQIIASNS